MHLRYLSLVSVFILLQSWGTTLEACSCAGHPLPCDSYERSAAVFIGYVSRVEPSFEKEAEEMYGEQRAYVQVEKSFKGVKKGQIVFHQPGHNCAPRFRIGERWLLYAHFHSKQKTWEVFGCGRSTLADKAHDDLAYLEGLPATAATTRLSGQIHSWNEATAETTSWKALSGIAVTILGEGHTYETSSDQNGIYEMSGLPPGKYSVTPKIPAGMKLRFAMATGKQEGQSAQITLAERSCAGADFVLSPASQISGRVFGPDGQLLSRVCLDIEPADRPPRQNFRIFDCTEQDGSYKLESVPPGKYFIVVNRAGRTSGDEPFPTAYYPGVFQKEKASIVPVTLGDHLENYDIRIPSQLPTSVIEGQLLYSDGQPVGTEGVIFKGIGYRGEKQYERRLSDDQGRFSLKLLQGSSGWIQGEIFAYPGKYADCPEVETLLKKTPRSMTDITTEAIRLDVQGDIREIKLVFPFQSCRKSDETTNQK